MPHEQGAWMLLCVSGGAVRVQTAASPRAGTCRLRRLGRRGDGKTGEMARFPKKGYPRDWSLGRVRAEPAVLPAGWRGNMAVAGRAARRSSPRAAKRGKGAFSPIRRHAQRRTCISIPCRLRSPSPVLPARLPALPERQTAPQHAFPRKPAKIRRATQQRLCPTGANSVAPALPQRPLPHRGKAAS